MEDADAFWEGENLIRFPSKVYVFVIFFTKSKPSTAILYFNILKYLIFKGTSVSHKTFRVYHVYCNFIPGYLCRITVILGTLKDGSPLIHIFVSNICFCCKNIFQNGIDALSKIDDAF